MMRKIFFIFCIAIIIANCKKGSDEHKTINGRWWYIEDANYKEIHANDSSIYVFDFSNYSDRCYQLEYEIRNDTFWTISPKSHFPSIDLKPFFRGKVVGFRNDSFIIEKDSKRIKYNKLVEIQDIYSLSLPHVFKNEKRDSIAWERWLNYQDKYDHRAMKFYKDNPEYTRK